MLATILIVFREVIEAGLIVGIVLAATKGVSGRGFWVSYGVLGGLAGAAVVASFAGQLGALFEGAGQEPFNAAILLVAAIMLAWHNVWMASHGRALAQEMKEVGAEVSSGQKQLAALAIVCGIAVLREGSEVVLFLYGIFASGGHAGRRRSRACCRGGAFQLYRLLRISAPLLRPFYRHVWLENRARAVTALVRIGWNGAEIVPPGRK